MSIRLCCLYLYTFFSRTLSCHIPQLQEELHSKEITASIRSSSQSAMDAIGRIMRVTDIYTQLKAFRVFGIIANHGLTASVFATAVSFYTAIFGTTSSFLSQFVRR